MKVTPSIRADSPPTYRHLSTRFEPQYGAFWLILDPKPIPCVSLELIDELRRFHEEMARMAEGYDAGKQPIRFFIVASRSPGVFNLGGDLSLFARCVAGRTRCTSTSSGTRIGETPAKGFIGCDAGCSLFVTRNSSTWRKSGSIRPCRSVRGKSV
jgi:hypothetical protein